jgi:hypothetical protein
MEFSAQVMLWLLMILSGPQDAIQHIPKETLLEYRDEFIKCAIQLEILPKHYLNIKLSETTYYSDEEGQYVVGPPERQCLDELNLIYENNENLKNVPLTNDIHIKLQVDEDICRKYQKFNRDLRKFLEKKKDWEKDREFFYILCMNECDMYENIWRYIQNIQSEDKFYRRHYWKSLANVVGRESLIDNSPLPECGPIWRLYKMER